MAVGKLTFSAAPSLLAGATEAIARVRAQLARVAPTESTVLLLGETGTGKGLAARELHAASPRALGPFVHVDCAALSESLVESELFGHERGAFTGAVAARIGRLELARGGTLFLDEIGELPLALQGKLLRALQDRRFERLGGTRTLALDARVVAATHRDLRAAVRAGRFRADLWYRLCVFAIELPPLRTRPDDVAYLLRRELPALVERLRVPPRAVKPEFVEAFARHAWPGNVRELLHALERALLLAEGDALDAAVAHAAIEMGRVDLEPDPGPAPGSARQAPIETTPALDGRPIAAVLRETGGNVSRAARRLGMARSTLRWQIQRLDLAHLIPED
ncbi:MAG TPA: sigma-54 dependent transcriptional regulator [Myxococcota bacterium]|nr:sigma-54 dependent transcriptional regulator [Myxococcota bacterium]